MLGLMSEKQTCRNVETHTKKLYIFQQLRVNENKLHRRNMKVNNSFLEDPNSEEQSLTRRHSPDAGSEASPD